MQGAGYEEFAGWTSNTPSPDNDPWQSQQPDPETQPIQQPRSRRSAAPAGTIEGVVRGFTQRQESKSGMDGYIDYTVVWDFALERHDKQGRPLAPISVQMRGLSFSGGLQDGHRVFVTGQYRSGRALRPTSVWNETTQTMIQAEGSSSRKRRLIMLPVAIFVICPLFACVVFTVGHAFSASSDYGSLSRCLERQEQGFQGFEKCEGSLAEIREDCETWPPLFGGVLCDIFIES